MKTQCPSTYAKPADMQIQEQQPGRARAFARTLREAKAFSSAQRVQVSKSVGSSFQILYAEWLLAPCTRIFWCLDPLGNCSLVAGVNIRHMSRVAALASTQPHLHSGAHEILGREGTCLGGFSVEMQQTSIVCTGGASIIRHLNATQVLFQVQSCCKANPALGASPCLLALQLAAFVHPKCI